MDERFTTYAPERDIYRLLQVDPRSDTETIVAACRRLARHYHPDYNDSPRATEEMQVVNTVRRVMTDPVARARYDRARERWLANQATARWPAARPSRDIAPPSPGRPVRTPPSQPRGVPGSLPASARRPLPGRAAPQGRPAAFPIEARPAAQRAIVPSPPGQLADPSPTLLERLDESLGPRMRSLRITVRAAVLGVRAGLVALAPARCHACRAAVGLRDRYCDSCGARLLETTATR